MITQILIIVGLFVVCAVIFAIFRKLFLFIIGIVIIGAAIGLLFGLNPFAW